MRGGALAPLLFATLAPLLAACGPSYRVTRVVDGRTVEGSFVPPEAYASFLRGAIAEDSGDLGGALGAYQDAAAIDPDDPEIWTRLGAVLCRKNATDPAARRAFARATSLDAEYAPAWAAMAACSAAAHEDGEAASAARRAADLDPRVPGYQALLAGIEGERADATPARNRLVNLTLSQPSSSVAFRALLAFARSHGDAALEAEAIARLAHLGTSRNGELVRATAQLAGEGEIPAARRAAGAIVDASSAGLSATAPAEPARDLVARLAVDDAIARGDLERVQRRATAAHLGLDLVAGRALLLGATDLAHALVAPVVGADPSARGARIVLATALAEHGAWADAAATLRDAHGTEPLPPEIALPLLRVLARATDATERSAASAAVADLGSFVAADDLTARAAVDASVAGTLDEARLPPEARVELAARRGGTYQGPTDRLDARHALLAMSLAPSEAGTKEETSRRASLVAHLRPAVGRDPIVTVAIVGLAMKQGAPLAASLVTSLERLSPADPLVLEAALDVARSRGDAVAEKAIKERIGALGSRSARF